MREILFRGKRVDNGEWVEGNYFIDERDIEDGYIWRDIPQIQEQYGDHYNYWDIIPETLSQYTGLKDKNGKKIFEGDIVLTCLGRDIEKAVVFYDDRVSSFGVSYIERAKTIEQINFFLDFVISAKHDNRIFVEVIGSVFDNPNC